MHRPLPQALQTESDQLVRIHQWYGVSTPTHPGVSFTPSTADMLSRSSSGAPGVVDTHPNFFFSAVPSLMKDQVGEEVVSATLWRPSSRRHSSLASSQLPVYAIAWQW